MTNETIYLLIRADDLGSSHAANQACLDVFTQGICRSVEIMAPCPWFPEAVKLLRQRPDYDVGVHLVLTSEWEGLKWRPVSDVKSLVTDDGYFYRTFWKSDDYPGETTLLDVAWTPADVERELRAQIELTLKHLPWTSHLTFHMGGVRADPQIKAIFDKLAREYNLGVDLEARGFQWFAGFGDNSALLPPEQKTQALAQNLAALTPGNWFFIDHPGYDTPEMRAIHHRGYEHVALDRHGVTTAWTSPQVKEIIQQKQIKLISYGDVKNGLAVE
jgi:predicted glycoside hydrolase/deacetylase ChbG (UPF0249 family)